MITVERTTLDGVLLIKPAAFEDHRGEYVELYNEELYRNHGISNEMVEIVRATKMASEDYE